MGVILSGRKLFRAVRMLRTALGPAIAAWLEDSGVIEVMLNPDGRNWTDRDGLVDTGEWIAHADGGNAWTALVDLSPDVMRQGE